VGSFVPLIGPLVALVVAYYVTVLGAKGVHETTRVRAVVSVAVPPILCLLLLATLIAAFFVFSQNPGAFDRPQRFRRIGTIPRHSLPRSR
jgi:hypothetical protein